MGPAECAQRLNPAPPEGRAVSDHCFQSPTTTLQVSSGRSQDLLTKSWPRRLFPPSLEVPPGPAHSARRVKKCSRRALDFRSFFSSHFGVVFGSFWVPLGVLFGHFLAPKSCQHRSWMRLVFQNVNFPEIVEILMEFDDF